MLKGSGVIILMLATLLMGGCLNSGSGSSNGSGNNPANGTDNQQGAQGPLDLSDVALVRAGAEPLDLLLMTGLPESPGVHTLHAEYRLAGDDLPIGPDAEAGGLAVMLEADEPGTAYLLVPLIEALEGSEIRLRVTDGTSYSDTLTLQIGSLAAPRPGTVTQWLDAIEGLIQATTEAYGLQYPDDLQSYLASPQSIDYEFIPLIRGYHAVTNPDNPDNLRNIAATLDDDEQRLLERVFAQTGVISEIQALTRFAASNDTLIAEALPHLQVMITQPSLTQSLMIEPMTDPAGEGQIILDAPYGIHGPADLKERLRVYNQTRFVQQTAETTQEYAGYFVTGVGIGAAFVVAGPGGGAGAAKALSSAKVASKVFHGADAVGGVMTITRGFFPCCLVDVRMSLLPDSGVVQHEDEDDPSLIVEGAVATVHSDGIDLVDDVALRVAKLAGKKRISDAYKDAYGGDAFRDELIDAGISEILKQIGIEGTEIVFEWPEVDIAGDAPQDWLEVEIEGFAGATSIFELSPFQAPGLVAYQLNAETFFGSEDVTNVLRVGPDPEAFELKSWHPPLPGDSRTVGARAIEVEFDPPAVRLDEPGGIVPFTVTARHARNSDIELPLRHEPEIGSIVGPLNSGQDGTYNFEYHPPPDELPTPSILIGTSAITRDGVRGRGEPPVRSGELVITTDAVAVAVTPRHVCLEQGESEIFQAADPLLGNAVAVTWSATLGSITPQGHYTAPAMQSPGYAVITATSTQDPDVKANARVTFGCSCWWDGSVGGDFAQHHADWAMSYFLDDAENITRLMVTEGQGDSGISVFIELDTPVGPGVTGTFTGRTSGGTFTRSLLPENIWSNRLTFVTPMQNNQPPVDPLQVTISRHEMLDPSNPNSSRPNRDLEATIAGTVYHETADDTRGFYFSRSGSLNLTMQGNRWFSVGFGGQYRCSPPR
ncbi:hypothetical protein HC341_13920 [Aquisalimonas sp. 2447]|uniref:hypothetical protein n=1 Tax=Aquisalimonas sp. 2447 TaxID=2740807 RepID=UPI0014323D96|nr:hypothetical protein [Aquisalimonas sp. 2447]QIT56196.1 hypothetical protein HC341_13920 [Aquisalimonas sp. 2447]